MNISARGLTIDDKKAPNGLRAHQISSDIYLNDFASMVDRVKMGRIICLLH